MNKYVAMFRGKKIEVEANTTYEAQLKAQVIFRARKSYEVTVLLAEKSGEEVTHDPSILG